ncbi:CurL C-terminal domain-containing protein, partial [Okeania hirsuta]|uniref:CurL C-terminal domain-containing protein n=1 Tax=Okeania hirsuta TaxID=1458930 RepID=UPI001961965D
MIGRIYLSKYLLNSSGDKRVAGVSSFAISGTNAHILLEEAPREGNRQQATGNSEDYLERSVHLLTLSAKTEKSLEDLVSSYQNYLEFYPDLAIADVCYTANTGRAHFNYRIAIITSEQKELIEKLLDWKTKKEVVGVYSGQPDGSSQSPKIAFLFTGQGSQYVNMGRQLYETQPTFRQALDLCDQILQAYLEVPLLEVIYTKDAQKSSVLDQTAYTQPALFSIEYAL